MLGFWTIIGYFSWEKWGINGILGVVAFLLFINLVTWDNQIKKLREKK